MPVTWSAWQWVLSPYNRFKPRSFTIPMSRSTVSMTGSISSACPHKNCSAWIYQQKRLPDTSTCRQHSVTCWRIAVQGHNTSRRTKSSNVHTGRTSEHLLGIGIGEQVRVGATFFLEELPEDYACQRHISRDVAGTFLASCSDAQKRNTVAKKNSQSSLSQKKELPFWPHSSLVFHRTDVHI